MSVSDPKLLWAGLLLSILCACNALPANAVEAIDVELFDGRRMTGEWVNRADEQRLWIVAHAPGIEIRSGFLWSDVRTAKPTQASDDHPASGMRQLPGNTVASGLRQLPGNIEPQVRVQSLQIETHLAQWDDDVQADGLQILVFPLAADGTLTAVNGEIELRLLGEIEPHTGGRHGSLMPKFRELERATSIVRKADFANGAAVYNLPFSQIHPDFNLDVASSAIVHARLGVPGQGAFEASDAQIELREFRRIRDQLQLHTLQRFFPIESGALPNR